MKTPNRIGLALILDAIFILVIGSVCKGIDIDAATITTPIILWIVGNIMFVLRAEE